MDNIEKNDDNHDIENIEKPSYTYWKRETDKPFSKEFQPQKSDTLNSQQNPNQDNVGSIWNKAGTWYIFFNLSL